MESHVSPYGCFLLLKALRLSQGQSGDWRARVGQNSIFTKKMVEEMPYVTDKQQYTNVSEMQ